MSDDDEQDIATIDAPPIFAGRWRLEGMLGAGAMGAVYRARDLELDEVVALKILTMVDASALGQFRDEVRLARKVTHRNVARTYDIGEHEGRRFLTMEHVQGHSLRGVLARGRLTTARARDVARQICAGVAAVHAEGIAHGDLKPDNVLVTEGGVLKVSDFGLACVIENAEGGMRGTPVYMAPEQLEGAPPDRRTDVYALGVILHELFTGRRPWTGNLTDIATQKILEDGAPIADDLPADVHGLVRRCLARDRNARPESAEELLTVLDGDPLAMTGGRSSLRAPSESFRIRVAVKSFRGEAPADAYLGAALAADLARILATASGLEVHLADDDVDARVEGTIHRVGMTVRFGLRLISTRDGYLLWARGGHVTIADALDAVESAANAIAQTLSAKTTDKPRLLVTTDPKLLDLYLRARHAEHRAWEEFGTTECDLYAELEAASPEDPLVLAGYSGALMRSAALISGSHAKAGALAERALLLAPDLPEAHLAVALNMFTGHAHEGAARAAMRGAALAPSLPLAQVILGSLLCETGLVEEGLRRLDLALALEPRLTMAWSMATIHRARQSAIGEIAPSDVEAALARAPRSLLPTAQWLYWLTRMRIAFYRGEAEARAVATEIKATPFAMLQALAVLAKVAERTATAAEIDAALTPLLGNEGATARPRAIGLVVAAECAAYLGDEATLAQTLPRLDATSTVDRAWFERTPILERWRSERWFRDPYERVVARAESVVAVLREIGVVG